MPKPKQTNKKKENSLNNPSAVTRTFYFDIGFVSFPFPLPHSLINSDSSSFLFWKKNNFTYFSKLKRKVTQYVFYFYYFNSQGRTRVDFSKIRIGKQKINVWRTLRKQASPLGHFLLTFVAGLMERGWRRAVKSKGGCDPVETEPRCCRQALTQGYRRWSYCNFQFADQKRRQLSGEWDLRGQSWRRSLCDYVH